ncbi:MAG: tyrosine-type recombinase/integrase [Saprospiraceae bacterium]
MLWNTFYLKHQTILTVIYGLGLRKAEVQHLLTKDINLERGTIHIRKAKGNKDRILHITNTLAKTIDRYLKEYKPQHWLFEGQTGGQYSATSIQMIFIRAKEGSILPAHLTVHGLRHSYATHMVENGTPLHTVKELLGHSSIQTTQVYLHTSSKKFTGLHDPLADL